MDFKTFAFLPLDCPISSDCNHGLYCMETYRKKQTQRQKKGIDYDFMRFSDSSTVHNLLKQ